MSATLNSVSGTNRCYTTLGLLGTYNNDPNDDLTTPGGQVGAPLRRARRASSGGPGARRHEHVQHDADDIRPVRHPV